MYKITYDNCVNVDKSVAVNMDETFTKKMDKLFKLYKITFDYSDLPYDTSHIKPSKKCIENNIYSNCVPLFIQCGIYHNPYLFLNFIPGYKENLYTSPGFFNEFINITVNNKTYKTSDELTNNYGKDDIVDIIKKTSRKEFDTLYDINFFKSIARIYDFQQILALVAKHSGVKIDMSSYNIQNWINLIIDDANRNYIEETLNAEKEFQELVNELKKNPINTMVCVHDLGKDWCWDDAIAIMFELLLLNKKLINNLHIISAGADPIKADYNHKAIISLLANDTHNLYTHISSGSADTDKYGPQLVGLIEPNESKNPQFDFKCYKSDGTKPNIDIFSEQTTVDVLAICAETSFIKDMKKGMHVKTFGIQGGFVKDEGFNGMQCKEATNMIMQ